MKSRSGLRNIACVGYLATAIGVLAAASGQAFAQAQFVEGFDDVGPTIDDGPQNLINQGWIFRNQSQPPGSESWFDGYTGSGWPNPQSGAGYMTVTSSSTDYFGGTVSNWAILPAIPNQQAGDELRFFALDLGGDNVNTLQVRYSPSGGTGTGSSAGDVGDFTQVLLDINPIPVGGWNLFSVSLPGDGRIALRYYIANACNFACFSSYTGIDSLSVGPPPPPPCNLPTIPTPGQTVTWTAAGSPYEVCQNIGIPPDATVIVEAGVQVDFDAEMQLQISGTLRLLGDEASPILFTHPAMFPPMLLVNGGTMEASFASFLGQVRVENGANATLSDCGFSGNGLLWAQELSSTPPFIHLVRCTFTSSQLSLSDALVVLADNTFENTAALVLRGYADLTAPNTFIGRPLEVIRERGQHVQPQFIDGVSATGVSSSGGLLLRGGTYALGPNVALQNNLYPLDLQGGLLPDSTVPTTGNTINAINAGDGGFGGAGRWPNLGLPYRLTLPHTSLPGGDLTIDPGVIIEAADPAAGVWFRSTRHGVFEGSPDAPITFRGLNGQSWDGLLFHVNSSTGPRLEYCVVEDAEFGVISTDNALYVDSCLFTSNDVGANTNTFGTIYFRKTRFVANGVGVSFTDQGSPFLNSATTPNSFEGNGVGADAFESGSSADARNCWWNHPTGPQAPGNPAGQGDSISGPGASNVLFSPFRTAPPDFGNTPPVVRMIEPGLTQLYASPDYGHPDYLLDPGTKYILQWHVESDDNVVRQRIEFSPDGHYPSRFTIIADDLPSDARSAEITIPEPGYAVTNEPQFLRVVALDAEGQEAWDQAPLLVPSGRITGDLTITTDLSGQTFIGGQSIPDVDWTGSVNYGTVSPLVVLEADGAAVQGLNLGSGHGTFFEDFPFVRTDTARLALQVRNNSNDVAWFFADGYFSIRHDPRLSLDPPSVELTSPGAGQEFTGGTIVPIAWNATAPEGLRSFDIQASYDSGRAWHPIVRDLPPEATSYAWHLPPSTGIADVRVRVIARDLHFQNSSDGGDVSFSITPGSGNPCPGDLNGDGFRNVTDFTLFTAAYGSQLGDPEYDPDADLNGDGYVNVTDFTQFAAVYGVPCP